jgi:hypothetical protein
MKPDWIEKEFGYVRKHVEQHWGRCILLVIGSLTLLTLSPPAYWGLVALIVAAAWAVWRFLLMTPDPTIRILDEIYCSNKLDYQITIMTDSETPLDSPSVTLIRSEPPLRHLGRDYVEPIPLCNQGLAQFLNCDAPLAFFLDASARQHRMLGAANSNQNSRIRNPKQAMSPSRQGSRKRRGPGPMVSHGA